MFKKIALLGCLLLTLTAYHQVFAAPAILVFGDSLSAGYGVLKQQGWVALLENQLRSQGYPHRVINASISGDTTAGGAARIKSTLANHQPDIVIVELGGNDGLRGLPIPRMQQNLANIINHSHLTQAKVLLVGMQIPPNYGPQYTRQFQTVYQNLASQFNIPLVPFLLDGLSHNQQDFQADQIHPNASAQTKLLSNVWPHLKTLLN